MPRITPVFRPTDHPNAGDPAIDAGLAELFETLFPGNPDPAFDMGHVGVALAAQNPGLALRLSQLSRFVALDLPWCARADLRELAIQAANRHFGSDFSFEARRGAGAAAGLSAEQLAAIPEWRTSGLFDEEQRLVVEYAYAVASGLVPADLSARMVAAFGEKGTVEATTVIGLWSFWAMFLNATHTT